MVKTFSDLYAAIDALPLDDPRREPLFGLWHDLEENEPEVALSKFDANVGDLSEACVAFWLAF